MEIKDCMFIEMWSWQFTCCVVPRSRMLSCII